MSYIDNHGYIRTGGRKNLLMHRVLMEEHINRKLKPNEVVHHKDGDILNNRMSNLEIISNSEHTAIHRKKKHRQHYNIEWLKQQLKYGITQREIAKKCGISEQAISTYIKKNIDNPNCKTWHEFYKRRNRLNEVE